MSILKRVQKLARAKLHAFRQPSEPETFSEAFEEVEESIQADPKATEAYRVLELDAGASPEEITAAYRKLCRKYHPDHYGNEPQKIKDATELLQEINKAYDYLKRKSR